jgi:DNA-binding CsgD family transcriptional regulator
LIDGAAGIGKTRVLDGIIERARSRGLDVLVTRPAEAEARVGLLGFHDLMDQLGSDALRALPGAHRERLEIALGLASAPSDRELDEGLLAVAVHALLRGQARSKPLIIAIDDLQWLDASTSALLAIVLRRLRDEPVRVVATRRATINSRLDLARIYRDRLLPVHLDGLSVGALHQLIGSRLGRSLPRPALIRLHALSEGNPLYALELARALPEGSRPVDALDATVPSVDALLSSRVARLSRLARDVVAVVALATRPDIETIAGTLGVTAMEVERAGDAAVGAGLMVEEPWGYGLAHPLVGAATSLIVGRARRRDLHRRLAEVVADPEQSAIHRSLGTVGPDEHVAAALELAADRLMARGASVDGAELLDRAIRLTPTTESDAILRRRLSFARALLLAGDTAGAVAEFRGIGIDAISDPTSRAEAVLLLGVVQRYVGEHAAAIDAHEEALHWDISSRTRARLHLRLAWHIERDLPAALDHVRAALELLDPESAPLDVAFATLTRARLELALGIRADHEAIARGQALQGSAIGRGWDVSTTPIDWAVWMDDWQAARSLLRAATQAAEESGDETTLGFMLRRQAEVETWAGRLAVAAELADSSVERAESSQQIMAVASARARRGLIHAIAGRVEQAEEDGEQALAQANAHANPIITTYALTALAHAARLRDDLRRVDELLTRATTMLDETGDVDHAAYRFHSDHLDALVGLGDLQRARALVERVNRRGQLGPRPTWAGVAARGLAAIALTEGRQDAAAQHIALALEIHADAGVPLEAARTRLLAAEIDRRGGRRKAAAAHLRSALALADRLGAEGWAARIRRDLDRLAPERRDLTTLTPAEERIAGLAADGLRNRDIAGRLAISEKTVEGALGRVYEKLGIRSRAQLNAGLTRAGEGDRTGTA